MSHPSTNDEPFLIGLCGKQGAGKDTVQKLLFKYIFADITQWRVVDTSRMICGMYAIENSLDFYEVRRDKYELRPQLQEYGDENRKKIIASIKRAVSTWLDNGYNCILNSVRTDGEYMTVKERNQYFLLVEADYETRKKRVPLISGGNHHTETGVIPLVMDEANHFRINNSGHIDKTLERLKSIAFYMDLG